MQYNTLHDAVQWLQARVPNILHFTALTAFLDIVFSHPFMSTTHPSVSPASGAKKKRKVIIDAPRLSWGYSLIM